MATGCDVTQPRRGVARRVDKQYCNSGRGKGRCKLRGANNRWRGSGRGIGRCQKGSRERMQSTVKSSPDLVPCMVPVHDYAVLLSA